jgi:hypothetical protein
LRLTGTNRPVPGVGGQVIQDNYPPFTRHEVPAGLGARQIEELRRSKQEHPPSGEGRLETSVHPALRDLRAEVSSGRYGELMRLRALCGHVGRPGCDGE